MQAPRNRWRPMCDQYQGRRHSCTAEIKQISYLQDKTLKFFLYLNSKTNFHKKVLLRERKRHTDRGVSSTPSVTRGGVPPPPGRGTPQPGLMGEGVPEVRYPPPSQVWQGVPEVGYPWLDLAGVPPPPDREIDGWKTLPSRRTTYAVGKNWFYGLFTLHGTGTGAGTGTENGIIGSQYIIQKCSHWSRTGTGTWSRTKTETWPIVSYCAIPCTCYGPVPVQYECAIKFMGMPINYFSFVRINWWI